MQGSEKASHDIWQYQKQSIIIRGALLGFTQTAELL